MKDKTPRTIYETYITPEGIKRVTRLETSEEVDNRLLLVKVKRESENMKRSCAVPLLCDACGSATGAFVYANDLEGSMFYCAQCH